jgi:hypothetical protein
MADRKITDLTALAAGSQATGDLLTIVDVSEGAATDKNKKITVESLFKGIPSNVGIGTSSPTSVLDVRDTQTGAASEIKLFNLDQGNTTTQTSALVMTPDVRANGAKISVVKENADFSSSANKDVAITFAPVSNNTATERMRIDSSGRVGIGATPNNDEKLLVHGGGDSIYVPFARSSTKWISLHSGGTNPAIFCDTGGAIRFGHGSSRNAFSTERMRIDTSGRVLIGTTTEGEGGADNLTIADSGNCGITLRSGTSSQCNIFFSDATSGAAEYDGYIAYNQSNRDLKIGTASSTRLTINSSGDVGIGTQSPTRNLHVHGSDSDTVQVHLTNSTTGATSNDGFSVVLGSDESAILNMRENNPMRFFTNDSERMRIDNSGRLLIGASSNVGSSSVLQVREDSFGRNFEIFRSYDSANTPARIRFSNSRGTSASPTIVVNGDDLGEIRFNGHDGTNYDTPAAAILGVVDGTPGENDMPGRLEFHTTSDGGSSTTERMRITKDGDLLIGQSSTDTPGFGNTTLGAAFENLGADGAALFVSRSNNIVAGFNRAQDGTIIDFNSAGNTEGSVSISGSTTSFNGGHLARWTQLAGNAERIEILRGSVLSNLDEMCEWGEEDNEQLNRMKVSDVEGDVNVSGVFQAWDDDDDTYTNDFYCAMTGDFVIRIAQGTTVARGDLLMSAGDGTAKPQDDDIVRSKTIAKVISTTVSTTYADGSYCVPCVLMAC